MGIAILDQVLTCLRDGDFTAEAAYPGQTYLSITEPVAAVHLEKVDREKLLMTVGVNIIGPASQGGILCEQEALRAMGLLRAIGGVCVQNGCSYDGVAQVYVVSILADFQGTTDGESSSLGPGFRVYVEDLALPWVVSFRTEKKQELSAQYTLGEAAPVGTVAGGWLWNLRLEELIPPGEPETLTLETEFRLYLESDTVSEEYLRCRWTGIQREYTREGLRKICTGISLDRREVASVG